MDAAGKERGGRRRSDRQLALLLDRLAAVHMDLAPLCSVELYPKPVDRAQIKRACDDLELALRIVRDLAADSLKLDARP
jgi:hypothetical protein